MGGTLNSVKINRRAKLKWRKEEKQNQNDLERIELIQEMKWIQLSKRKEKPV